MKKFALINKNNNLVSNIIILNENSIYAPPEDTFMVDVSNIFVNIGWIYDDSLNQFIPPPSSDVE